MRYHLETIPVIDAYKKGGECPLCDLYAATDAQYVANALGGAVMESENRIESNEKGFCAEHMKRMFQHRPRLGMALIMHTHLLETTEVLSGAIAPMTEAADCEQKRSAPMRALRRATSRSATGDPALAAALTIRRRVGSCALCEKTNAAMRRYLYTIIHQYKTQSAFRDMFDSSRALCLPHLADLLEMTASHPAGEYNEAFLKSLAKIQNDALNRLAGELEWFTLKHDYRYANEDWKSSRDALPRVINKLAGRVIAQETPD